MIIIKTKFQDAFLLKPKVFFDNRGFFLESFSSKQFKENISNIDFVQDNHSMSLQKNTIRGLHFQKEPMSQSKLVRVINGAIQDVIVDLRQNQKTFSQWESYIITSENFLQLFVPQGFAHGFCTLKPNTEIVYKVDNCYSKDYDSGIIWNDIDLNIDWLTNTPVLSEKDKNLQTFKDFLDSNVD